MASEGTLSIRRAKHVTTRAALVARQELAIDRDSDSGADRARRGAAKERGDDRAGETPKMGPAGPAMMPATASASAPASATAIPLVAPRMLPIVRLVWRARLHVSIRDD